MDTRTQVMVVSVGLFILASVLWAFDIEYNIFGGYISGGGYVVNACYPLSFEKNIDGTYKIPKDYVCKEGIWINTSKTDGFDKYCDAYYKLVEVSYTDIEQETAITEAKGYEFCEDGVITTSPLSCGNAICESGENTINCWFDCGPMQDWRLLDLELQQRPDLDTYIESESTFRYDLVEVDQLVAEIESTNPKTPFEAIRTTTRIIASKLDYVPGGYAGNVQCGENSATILQRGTGNCVDYSTVMIAVLRHGFYIEELDKRVQIPARQIAGCLSGVQSFYAVEYNPEYDEGNLYGSVIGHSWLEVWVGGARWVMADPTTNTALAKTWFGYHKVAEVSGEQVCYVPIEDRAFCEVFSEGGST